MAYMQLFVPGIVVDESIRACSGELLAVLRLRLNITKLLVLADHASYRYFFQISVFGQVISFDAKLLTSDPRHLVYHLPRREERGDRRGPDRAESTSSRSEIVP